MPVSAEPVMVCVSWTPAPLYSVDKLLLLSEIQNGKPGATAIPHGFCRLASIFIALATNALLFATNAVSVNPVAAGGSAWPVLLPLMPLPPPHAATVRTQATPSCADSD